MTPENILKRLAYLIFEEIEKGGYTTTYFADVCGLHRNAINSILCGSAKDIKLSTIIKICENSNITYAKLFNVTNKDIFDTMIRKCYFTDGKHKWYFEKRFQERTKQ